MAQQKGIIQLKGSIGNLVAYTLNGKHVVRSKHSIDKKRIEEDPAFEGTRKHHSEFKHTSTAGKLFRGALWPFISDIAQKQLNNPVTSKLWHILERDPAPKGERTVYGGLRQPGSAELLKGFELNEGIRVARLLKAMPQVDMEAGTVALPGFTPEYDLSVPKRATHVCFSACMAWVDLEKEAAALWISEEVEVGLEEKGKDVVLKCFEEGERRDTEGGMWLMILKVKVVEKEWDETWVLKGGGRVVGVKKY